MIYDIIETTEVKTPSSIDDFADAVIDRMLICRASGLRAIGINSVEEISPAIEKAMEVCATYGLSVTSHFKKIYISSDDGGAPAQDWMLSKFAYMLVTINCPPSNPNVGGFQIALIKKFLST